MQLIIRDLIYRSPHKNIMSAIGKRIVDSATEKRGYDNRIRNSTVRRWKGRSVWDSEVGRWYIFIVDAIAILTWGTQIQDAVGVIWKSNCQKKGASCTKISCDWKCRCPAVRTVKPTWLMRSNCSFWFGRYPHRKPNVKKVVEYATLTDVITQSWSGMTTRQHEQSNGLKTGSLRDSITDFE